MALLGPQHSNYASQTSQPGVLGALHSQSNYASQTSMPPPGLGAQPSLYSSQTSQPRMYSSQTSQPQNAAADLSPATALPGDGQRFTVGIVFDSSVSVPTVARTVQLMDENWYICLWMQGRGILPDLTMVRIQDDGRNAQFPRREGVTRRQIACD